MFRPILALCVAGIGQLSQASQPSSLASTQTTPYVSFTESTNKTNTTSSANTMSGIHKIIATFRAWVNDPMNLGITIGAAALFLLIIVIIIVACCKCRKRRSRSISSTDKSKEKTAENAKAETSNERTYYNDCMAQGHPGSNHQGAGTDDDRAYAEIRDLEPTRPAASATAGLYDIAMEPSGAKTFIGAGGAGLYEEASVVSMSNSTQDHPECQSSLYADTATIQMVQFNNSRPGYDNHGTVGQMQPDDSNVYDDALAINPFPNIEEDECPPYEDNPYDDAMAVKANMSAHVTGSGHPPPLRVPNTPTSKDRIRYDDPGLNHMAKGQDIVLEDNYLYGVTC